jgi:putative addiction module component (TIGR02574 family)
MPMRPATEQLLQAALALPEEERLELAEALLASHEHDPSSGLPFDPAWLGEIQRRSAEIEAGTVQSTPWPVVRERVRQRLAGW